MANDQIQLPCPPRRFMAAGDGCLVAELEENVVAIRKGYSILSEICRPEEKGERLLWPAGYTKCVMLGHTGLLKTYEGRTALGSDSGVIAANDELVDTTPAGAGSHVILVGTMRGEALELSIPEFRFVWVSAQLEKLGHPGPPLPHKPIGWGVHHPTKHLIFLARVPEGEKLMNLDLESGASREILPPAELQNKRITGMDVDALTGNLAVTCEWEKGAEAGMISNPALKYSSIASGLPGDRMDAPLWSPDGKHLIYRKETKAKISLMATRLAPKLSIELHALKSGDEMLWLDNTTLAVVSWDIVNRIELAP